MIPGSAGSCRLPTHLHFRTRDFQQDPHTEGPYAAEGRQTREDEVSINAQGEIGLDVTRGTATGANTLC